jgi:hypothetical protein
MSWSDRVLAVESVGMLAAARILVITARGNSVVSRIGTRVDDAKSAGPARSRQSGDDEGNGERVGAMLERVSRFTWWRSMCLEKALAGKWMLRRRGIASTMYLGMAKQGERFVAHAWLVAEGQTLTGSGNTVYATLVAFGESPRSRANGADPRLR